MSFPEEVLLAELHAVSKKLGDKPVTMESFNQHSRVNAETIRRRFGSWGTALRQAGLQISKLGQRHTDDDYFENLLAVWTHYGRQPKYGEMDRLPSAISSGAYEAKWGTLTKALLAFIERVNDDTCASTSMASVDPPELPTEPRLSRRKAIKPPRLKGEDRHEIKLGLRYEILKRDCFRCVTCGASPAAHLGCGLHVDHKTPFSKGGKTVAENLRTLCDRCNLGKAAKVEA